VRRRWRDVPAAALMLAPSAALLGIFVVYPLGRAVWLGRQKCNVSGKGCRTVGWRQYVDVWSSKPFQNALGNTVEFVLMTVPIGIVLGVGLAVLADKQLRGIGVFRTIFSSTIASSVAVSSLIWLVLLNPQIGLLSDLLKGIFPVVKKPGVLRDGGTAMWGVAVSSIWAGLGFTFVIVTAALQSVPRELYESAFVDGAGPWRRFTNVTLPLLSPTLLFVAVVMIARAFQTYGEVDLLTEGGPNNAGRPTETIAYLIYGKSSKIRNDIGIQSASAVLLFLLLLVVSFLQFRVLERRVHYGD
jgi:ABC-type sugar transport system permease subunit